MAIASRELQDGVSGAIPSFEIDAVADEAFSLGLGPTRGFSTGG